MAKREFLKLLRRARHGDADAQLALARLYLAGRTDVPVNAAAAIHWLARAVALGLPDAHWLLACCYRDGRGLPVNLDLARAHAEVAASAGVNEARVWLASPGVRRGPPRVREPRPAYGAPLGWLPCAP